MSERAEGRRALLRGSIALGALVVTGCAPKPARLPVEGTPDAGSASGAGVSPVEDLMREHGLVARVLLVYEELAHRLDVSAEMKGDALSSSARIVQTFVHGYHEKLEEEHVFPRFEAALTHLELVRTLRDQHEAGRKLTTQIERAANGGSIVSLAERRRVAGWLRAFARMYRPHAAREDTQLFPDFRALLTPAEYDRLGEEFETRERALFGPQGFDGKVTEISQIERQLDLYELGRFTPGDSR